MRLMLTLTYLVFFPIVAFSHALAPATMDINFGESRLEGSIEIAIEAVMAGISPDVEDTDDSPYAEEYNRLRGLPPEALIEEFTRFQESFAAGIVIDVDGTSAPIMITDIMVPEAGDEELLRPSKVFFAQDLPDGSQNMIIDTREEIGAIILRVFTEDGEVGYSKFLSPGGVSDEVSLVGVTQQPFWRVFFNYIAIGFEHILPLGLDHILFVVGLFLLSIRLSPLLWQVSAFTVAHTITLAAGMLGIISIPASIVEPLIALSIVYVAIENVMLNKLSPWRPAIIFGFGLLHGLGFAGVLTEFGLPKGQFVSALIGFNIGVEIGQLTVIAICFAAFGYWFGKKDWYRRVITIPMSLGIAVIASYWFYERVFL